MAELLVYGVSIEANVSQVEAERILTECERRAGRLSDALQEAARAWLSDGGYSEQVEPFHLEVVVAGR